MGYIGAYWFRLLFVLLCMMCSTLTSMAGTYLLRDVYNVLTVPADTATPDTIPAATFTRNPETGEVTVTPGVVEYIITGTI